jgi:hypothetical protein
MMNKLKRMYAEIAKVEAQEDGTLRVYGWASSGAVDSDGETITPDAMKAALPDYMKFGAVREMHQPKAAGTAIEAEVQDDGRTWFGAHVVDPIAVKKVETGVYKGFSVGGKVTERDKLDKTLIKAINLVEVSLVDRPANPEAVFTMYKAERTPEDDVAELAELLDAGTVSPAELLEMVKGAREVPIEPIPAPAAAGDPATGSEASAASDEAGKAASAGDELTKSMYDVSQFAQLLQGLAGICGNAGWEAQYEADSSPIPAAMRDWLKSGVGIFQAMAAEETAELVNALQAAVVEPAAVEVVALADAGGDIAKAGARFSAATKAALAGAHEAMKTACDYMDKLGYADADKAEGGDDLAKLTGEIDLLKADMAKVVSERDELAKRVKALEAQPAPGKALLKAISKADDVAAPAAPQSAVEALPKDAPAEQLVKAQIIDIYRTSRPVQGNAQR